MVFWYCFDQKIILPAVKEAHSHKFHVKVLNLKDIVHNDRGFVLSTACSLYFILNNLCFLCFKVSQLWGRNRFNRLSAWDAWFRLNCEPIQTVLANSLKRTASQECFIWKFAEFVSQWHVQKNQTQLKPIQTVMIYGYGLNEKNRLASLIYSRIWLHFELWF